MAMEIMFMAILKNSEILEACLKKKSGRKELVLEELDEQITKAFYDKYKQGTLIYKERSSERF